MGSLSNNDGDGDGYENVTLKSEFTLPQTGVEFQRTVPKDRKRKKEVVVFCSRPLQNVRLGIFTS